MPNMKTKTDIEYALALLSERTGIKRLGLLGSLAAIGSEKSVPLEMLRSPDMDVFTPDDEDRIFELSETYRKNGKFYEETGLYADPLSVGVTALPDGWRMRSKLYRLENGAILQIPNINDIAVSKLFRFAQNDQEWLAIGLINGLLEQDDIYKRISLTNEDFESIQQARNNLVYLTDKNCLLPPVDLFDYVNGETHINHDFTLSFNVKWNRGYEVNVIHLDDISEPIISKKLFHEMPILENYLDCVLSMSYQDFLLFERQNSQKSTKSKSPTL